MGTKLELLALASGGMGGRIRSETTSQDTDWNFTEEQPHKNYSINEDKSSGFESDTTVSSDDTLDDGFFEEEEDLSCLTDLDGNRILPIRKLIDVIQKHMCCRKCAIGYRTLVR